jgi:hypothetical protein
MGQPRLRCFNHILENEEREGMARNCKAKTGDVSTINTYKMETR